MTTADLELTPLEVASGLLLGDMPLREELPDAGGLLAREAFEAAVLRGLERAPCGVSFSGGRDSSAVLAVATRVARREGLPDPVPITLRFPGVGSSDESAWQEQVVRHLGLQQWERVVLDDQVDAIGPYAQSQLRRHGLLWPPNTHFHIPIFERVQGGSLLTGVGGDEVLLPSDWLRVNRVLDRSIRLRPKDVLRIGLAYGPRSVRHRWLLRDAEGVRLPWLRPAAQAEVMNRFASGFASEPVRWDAWVRRAWWRDRARLVGNASLTRIAGDAHCVISHPMQDPGFLSGLADERGRSGFYSRTDAMRTLFTDDLPPELLSRRTKAYFDDVFLGPGTRTFMRMWDGGHDDALVDPEQLRAHWRGDGPVDGRSVLMLQSMWLETHVGS